MIRRLEIRGFKRFAECSLEMAPLTVLTGTNGAGKTSTIHALLLARLVNLPTLSGRSAAVVPLNGPFGLELGTAQDVLNINTALENSEIEIAVQGDAVDDRFVLDAQGEKLYLPIKRFPEDGRMLSPSLAGSNRQFTYLCAERLGPRETLRASAHPDDDLGVGVQGEFCAQVLAIHGMNEKIAPARRHPDRQDDVDSFLKYQVEAWLSDVVRPVEIETVWYPNTSITALRFRSPGGEWVRAPNMGFGVSYALPIVVAGLFAPQDRPSMLVIENPEAHLHPAGQSRIGVFLAQMAASGVQVLLETHSDHVLNGIRRAIGEHQVLKAADAVTHFFDMETDADPRITTLRFTETGGISEWPRRFFDQYQLDVAALTRVRRPKRAGG